MKTLKIIGVIVVLLIILVAGGGYYLFSNIGNLVKYAVETGGPKVTQTAVTLSNADIDLVQGSAKLTGFEIANPKGFNSDYVFNLGKMQLDIDTTSLNSNVIVIKTLDVEGVDVQVEQKGSQINLWQLQKNLKSSAGSGETEQESGGSEKTFMIEKLRFAEGKMNFLSDKFGEKQLTLPTLSVENLGNRSEGLTTEELGKAILMPLLENAKKAAEKLLESEIKGKISDKLEEKLDEELGGKLSEKLKDKESLEKAKDKLKQLF